MYVIYFHSYAIMFHSWAHSDIHLYPHRCVLLRKGFDILSAILNNAIWLVEIIISQRNHDKNLSNFVVSTVHADGLAPKYVQTFSAIIKSYEIAPPRIVYKKIEPGQVSRGAGLRTKLTHWDQAKMGAISQMTPSNAFFNENV